MGMTSHKKNVLLLHIAVMLFSVSGVVAQYVSIPAVLVALGRVICSSSLLFIIIRIRRMRFRLDSRKDYLLIIIVGFIMGLHWTSFFQSIQTSSVAIGTITFSTFPLFLTFMEPVVFREKLTRLSVLSSILLIIGVLITVPEFSMGNQVTVGILWGMLSSFTYALITLANRYFSPKYEGMVICFYEQASAVLVLLPALFIVKAQWYPADFAGVAFIGFVSTAFAYTLYVSAQKEVRAQTAGVISGMETVYGIFFALILLGEVPSVRELAGGALIMATALYISYKS